VEELNPFTLSNILTVIRDFKGSNDLTEDLRAFYDQLEAMICVDSVIRSLGEKLKTQNKDFEDILSYFTAVGGAVVDPLLQVLHNVEGGKLHREICRTLIAVAGDGISDVIDRLDVDKPEVAFDAVYLANETGMTTMSPKIQELLFYPDVSVKEEMIKFVSRIEDSEAIGLLLAAMDDEDKRIRIRAMEAASQKNDRRVLERLTELALGKVLAERSSDEQEMIFKALGCVGDGGTVDELRKFVERRNFMHFGKQRENKFLAIRALERIHSPASLGALKQLTEDSNRLVQTRAQRAYDSLAKSLRAERELAKPKDQQR
jgi:hypothetical protein